MNGDRVDRVGREAGNVSAVAGRKCIRGGEEEGEDRSITGE
jgi:hypothetical protein